jgi:hypothetical protein
MPRGAAALPLPVRGVVQATADCRCQLCSFPGSHITSYLAKPLDNPPKPYDCILCIVFQLCENPPLRMAQNQRTALNEGYGYPLMHAILLHSRVFARIRSYRRCLESLHHQATSVSVTIQVCAMINHSECPWLAFLCVALGRPKTPFLGQILCPVFGSGHIAQQRPFLVFLTLMRRPKNWASPLWVNLDGLV